MTDPEEFDFDWNARNNAKPLDERTLAKAAAAAVMEIGPTAEGKAELDRVLDEIERNASKKLREDCEKQAAMVEMFPALVALLRLALTYKLEPSQFEIAISVVVRAEALLP